MVDPARVYRILMERLPQFVTQVINDAMLAERVAYHSALAEAAHQFARELCPDATPMPMLAPGLRTMLLSTDPEVDTIVVGSHRFSRRHFAKNYDTHFSNVVATRFRDLHAIVIGAVSLTSDALSLELLPLELEKSQPATASNPDRSANGVGDGGSRV